MGLPLLSMDLVKSSIVLGLTPRGPQGIPEPVSGGTAQMGGPAGQLAFDVTYELVKRCLADGVSVIVEKAWQRGKSEGALAKTVGDARAVQIHVGVSLDVAVQRGRERPPRPGLVDMQEVARHLDAGRLSWDSFAPLDLNIPLHSMSTEPGNTLDLAALERFIWTETASPRRAGAMGR